MRMMRCNAEIAIHVVGTDRREELWPGVEVDADRELAPGFTVADAIRGREDCFVAVEPPAAARPFRDVSLNPAPSPAHESKE